MRHGAHHDAQMFTITGVPRSPTRTPSKSSAESWVSRPASGSGAGVPLARNDAPLEGRVTAYPTMATNASRASSFVFRLVRLIGSDSILDSTVTHYYYIV